MDTKERILKFLLGRAISRRDYDEAKAEYEKALATANDELKQMASAYLQSVLSNQSANPKTNKHARHTGAEAYRIATTMLNGTFDEAAALTPLGTTSVRTRRQDYADAGNVAADFIRFNLNNPTGELTSSTTTSSTLTSSTTGGRYYFKPLLGLSAIADPIGVTRGYKVRAYAQLLRDNIQAAKEAADSGKTVYGGVNGMYDDLEALNILLQKNELDPYWDSDAAYNTLLRTAGKYEDGSTWSAWFGDLLPMSSEIDKRKAAIMREHQLTEYDLADQSEWARKLAKTKGYKFFKDKAGNIRIWNNDFTEQIKDILEYNYNFLDRGRENSGFGHALIVDENGNVFLDDSKKITTDSPFYERWSKKLGTDRDARNNSFWQIDYKYGQNDYGDYRGLAALENKFGSFNGLDVSNLFLGNDPIFVTAASPGLSYYDKDDYFGGIYFNNNARFYKITDNGEVEEVSWDLLKDKYNPNGWEGEGKELIGKVTDLDRLLSTAGPSEIDLNSDMGGRDYWSNFGTWEGGLGAFFGGLLGAGIAYSLYDNIIEDVPGFVHNLLNAVANPSGELHTKLHGIDNNSELLQKLKYKEKENEYIKLLYQLFKEQPELWNSLSDKEKETFVVMKRAFNRSQVQKEGGVLKAARGTVLDGTGMPIEEEPYRKPARAKAEADYDKLRELYKKSQEKGYGDDIYRKQASEEKMFGGSGKMTTADILRISTMAQDAASIVASFVPGAGTGVSAALGVTALGTDLTADVLDPAVSKGEVAKNAIMNAGFAALGMIPGAKMGKVAKNVVKYLPKIITAAAGLGIVMDESTLNTFKKLGDGTTTLNREDWRNLSHVLSLIAAGTRGIKGDVARYKVKKGNVASSDNVRVKGGTTTDANGKEIPLEITKEQAKSINEKLSAVTETKEGDTTISAKENAIKILTEELKITPEEANTILSKPIGVGKVKAGKYKIETSETVDTGKTYDNFRAIWNEEAKAVKKSSKAGKWLANKLGGGAYTAKQRAILEELSELERANLLDYKTRVNPMIDWLNIRANAGEATMKARPVTYEIRNITDEQALKSHRSNVAKTLLDKKQAINEKAGVTEAEARIDENTRGIEGLQKAITANDEEIARIKTLIETTDRANKDLLRQIHELELPANGKKTGKLRLLESRSNRSSREVKAAFEEAVKVLGKNPRKNGNGYSTPRGATPELRKAIDKLNRAYLRLLAVQEELKGLNELALGLRDQLDKGRISIENFESEINRLTAESENGIRQILRRLENHAALESAAKSARKRAVEFYPKYINEAENTGLRVNGNIDKAVRVGGSSIKKGATIHSYEWVKNSQKMPPAGYKNIKLADFYKTFTLMKNLRGAAYNPTTNDIIVWKDGGAVNYQKLRK